MTHGTCYKHKINKVISLIMSVETVGVINLYWQYLSGHESYSYTGGSPLQSRWKFSPSSVYTLFAIYWGLCSLHFNYRLLGRFNFEHTWRGSLATTIPSLPDIARKGGGLRYSRRFSDLGKSRTKDYMRHFGVGVRTALRLTERRRGSCVPFVGIDWNKPRDYVRLLARFAADTTVEGRMRPGGPNNTPSWNLLNLLGLEGTTLCLGKLLRRRYCHGKV